MEFVFDKEVRINSVADLVNKQNIAALQSKISKSFVEDFLFKVSILSYPDGMKSLQIKSHGNSIYSFEVHSYKIFFELACEVVKFTKNEKVEK